MIDFIQCWFNIYSIYLAGYRLNKVQTFIEKLILSVYVHRLGQICVDSLADMWFACVFMS
jgi:hypothetical protein